MDIPKLKVIYTNKNMVISAPTSSGKTVILVNCFICRQKKLKTQ